MPQTILLSNLVTFPLLYWKFVYEISNMLCKSLQQHCDKFVEIKREMHCWTQLYSQIDTNWIEIDAMEGWLKILHPVKGLNNTALPLPSNLSRILWLNVRMNSFPNRNF